MKHKSPQGPSAHRGGHIWAVPSPVGSAIWGDLGSGSPWGAGPGLGSPPRGALVTPSSLLLLSYCCKYFNEMEKEKKKDKKKRKSHHLKPPGACGPGQPRLCGAERAARPRQPGLLCVRVHPGRAGGPPEQLFTIQRQTPRSRSNSETKNLFPSRPPAVCHHLLLRPPAPGIRPPALLGRVPHCLPQDQRPVCPSPPHWPRGDTLTPKDAFRRDGCATPFAFLLLVLCSWGAGEGPEGAQGSGGAGRGWARGEQRRPPAHSPSSAKPGASTPAPPVSRVPLGPVPPPLGSVASPHLPVLSTSAPTPPCLSPLPLFSQVP